jgi:hypothetical protein
MRPEPYARARAILQNPLSLPKPKPRREKPNRYFLRADEDEDETLDLGHEGSGE